ncbi:hypothetical protein [Georgenia sp. Marseille-Q6866]
MITSTEAADAGITIAEGAFEAGAFFLLATVGCYVISGVYARGSSDVAGGRARGFRGLAEVLAVCAALAMALSAGATLYW